MIRKILYLLTLICVYSCEITFNFPGYEYELAGEVITLTLKSTTGNFPTNYKLGLFKADSKDLFQQLKIYKSTDGDGKESCSIVIPNNIGTDDYFIGLLGESWDVTYATSKVFTILDGKSFE